MFKGLDAGSVFVRLGAITALQGFADYDVAVDKAKRHKEHYVRLGAVTAGSGFAEYDKATNQAEASGQRLASSSQKQAGTVTAAWREMATATDKYLSALDRQLGTTAGAYNTVGEAAQHSARMQQAASRESETAVAGQTASVKKAAAEQSAAWNKARTTFLGIGKAAGIVGAVVGIAGVKMAADFQKNIEMVHTQAGASQAEVDKLRKKVLDLAPAVGEGPTKLAEGLFHIESAGIRGGRAMDILKMSAEGARVGNADLQKTVFALLGVMKTAPLDIHSAAEAMGVLNDIVGHGDMRMNDLVGAMSTGIMPAAKNVGLGLRDVGAALDVMTTRGVPAQEAATRLRMTFALMSAPTKQAQKSLETIGLSQDDLAKKMRGPGGLASAVELLKKHLEDSGKSATQQNQIITRAFGGGRSSAAIETLVQNVDDLRKHQDQLNKQGAASRFQQDWKDTQKTFSQQVAQIWAGIQRLLVILGDKLIPVVKAVVSSFIDFTNWLGKHKVAADILAGVLGGVLLAALTAIAVTITMKVVNAFKTLLLMGQWVGDKLPLSFLKTKEAVDATTVSLERQAVAATEAQAAMGRLAVTGEAVTAGGVVLPRGAANPGTSAETALMGGGRGAAATGAVRSLGSRLTRGAGISLIGVMGSQMAGSAIGGRGGRAVSSIGTDASIGAGFGMMFGPEGAVGGAILGGLFGTLNHFLRSDAQKYGDKMASELGAPLKHMPVGVDMVQYHKDVQRAQKTIQHDMEQARHDMSTTHVPFSGGRGIPYSQGKDIGPTKKDVAEAQKLYEHAGLVAAQSLAHGYEIGAKYFNSRDVFKDFTKRFDKVPAAARDAGAKSIIEWAHGMEAQHRLPEGATDKLIKSLEDKYPGLKDYLKKQATDTNKTIASELGNKRIIDTVQKQVDDMGKLWHDAPKMAKTDGNNVFKEWQTALENLRKEIKNNHNPAMKKDFTTLYDQLKGESKTAASAVANHWINSTSGLASGSHKNLQALLTTFVQSFGEIDKQTSEAAKMFGVKAIKFALQNPKTVKLGTLVSSYQAVQEYGNFAHATGGIPNPSASAADDHYIVGPNGPIASVSGSEGIVNTPQMHEINLWGQVAKAVGASQYGSLDELWGSGMTHYAKGGPLPKYATGGQPKQGSHYSRLISAADLVSSRNFPYHLGGGHEQPSHLEPFDCSGAVSYIVQQAGYKVPTTTSGNISSWHFPKGGGEVDIFYNPEHTFMKIGNRYWGTSGFARPNGGAGWFDQSPGAGYLKNFNVVHLPNLGAAGNAGLGIGNVRAPQIHAGIWEPAHIAQGSLNDAAKYANSWLGKQGSNINQGQPLSAQGAPGSLNRGQIRGLLHQAALPDIFGFVSYAETGWNPNSVNSIGASGLLQIRMPMHAADMRQAGGTNILNPLTNFKTGKVLYDKAGHTLRDWAASRSAGQGGGWGQHVGQKFAAGGRLLKRFATGGRIGHASRRHNPADKELLTRLDRTDVSAASSISPRHIKVPHNTVKGLGDLSKFANLPDISIIDSADTTIGDLTTQYGSQTNLDSIVDAQVTPDDTKTLVGLKEQMLHTLNTESGQLATADTTLHGQLTSDQTLETKIRAHATAIIKKINQIKRKMVLEARRLAKLRHTRAGKVMGIAQKLANDMAANTDKRTKLAGQEATIHGRYAGRLSGLHKRIKAAHDKYATQRANVRGTGHSAAQQRKAIDAAERREVGGLQSQVTSIEGERRHALSGPQKQMRALTLEASHQRKHLGDQRRKYQRQGWDQAWQFQVQKWKLQDKLKALQDQAIKLTGSATKIGSGGELGTLTKHDQELTTAIGTVEQRQHDLPGEITDTALDILSLSRQSGLAIPDDVKAALASSGLVLPSGWDQIVPGGTAGGGDTSTGAGGTGSPADIAAAAYADYQNFQSQAGNLFQQFGSNFVAGPTMQSVLQSEVGQVAGARYFGATGAAAASDAGLSSTGAQQPSPQFTQVNNYSTGPEDPHIHAQTSKFEFQAAF